MIYNNLFLITLHTHHTSRFVPPPSRSSQFQYLHEATFLGDKFGAPVEHPSPINDLETQINKAQKCPLTQNSGRLLGPKHVYLSPTAQNTSTIAPH